MLVIAHQHQHNMGIHVHACDLIPTSFSITVAASDSANDFAYFSNYGTCVDIIAPVSYSLLLMFHYNMLVYTC